MQEVRRWAVLDADAEAVLDALSPESVVEYEGTFSVQSVEEAPDGWEVTATAPQLTLRLRFEELPNGYAYEQIDEGPFETLETSVTVHDDDEGTKVVAASTYTFGGVLARATDWLALSDRRDELERLLLNLGAEVADEDEDASVETG